ncbi:PSD1 and planctomycete cytochrome C domain-containing protein [Schlesneria paludicola]|uniref:PSD1 and planctomycete cytochrome C domain-containing protein n=1 Tax=Schlesneria paludicola TaxID=360056 RepID=UPI00138ABC62|nr:PSD1 and planctomycete cytochrome C domain-containing protein [Schlesneria paludicola]
MTEATVKSKPIENLLILSLMTACMSVVYIQADEDKQSVRELPPVATQEIDFVRDIQPIFQRACARCHGEEKQKGDYRLDVRQTALHGGESYAPNIVAKDSANSPLIQFVAGTGDLKMPPEGPRLSPAEIGLLRAWIDQGAKWPDSIAGTVANKANLWSIKPLVRASVPVVAAEPSTTNPIDAFIRYKLNEHGFSTSPEADRRTLIRRIYFDVIGLPPSPEEVDAFLADSDTKAYEKLVDRLLDSPHYGERWARHWLDAAHFAETHGHDQDRIRENAWPYRDYLIQAFNRDTPYDRFIQEQIAADAMFPDDPSLIPALGFLAAGPWDESSLRDIREDTLDRQIARYLDRDDMLTTVMSNVASVTVHCARCHDHKFDPISQRDYYALQAVFSGVERANRKYDVDSRVRQRRIQLTQRRHDLEHRSPAVMAELETDAARNALRSWEQQIHSQRVTWHLVDPQSWNSSDGATLTKLEDASIYSDGARPDKDTVTIESGPLTEHVRGLTTADATETTRFERGPTIKRITAVRLEVLDDDRLPQHGPGRNDNGNFHLSEFEIYVDDQKIPEALLNAKADFDQQSWEIGKAIDHNNETAWGIHPKEGVAHHATFELQHPLTIRDAAIEPASSNSNDSSVRKASRLRFVLKQLHGRAHLIGRMRISLTDAISPLITESLTSEIAALLEIPTAERTQTQWIELARHQQLESINQQIAALPKQSLVYAAAADFDPDGSLHPPPGPRSIHLLHRGDIRNPRDEISPGALSCVTSLAGRFEIPAGTPESARRVALAQWLTNKSNPLTWRSIVNRVWHLHIGHGLVGSLNDFGHMGETPSHPELLDWLAVEFRDGGQSLKTLHRLILTSRTYRQTVASRLESSTSPRIDPRVAADADNRLLWRMNRIRLDAESIRDSVLAISGQLDLRMGGPSDRHFDLKPGHHVTPKVDYSKFDPSSDQGRRRSIYRFLFRTLPDPFMESLDCPSGDQITPVRSNSVTIQQALALWNDAFIASYCEQIAVRIERDCDETSATASGNQATLIAPAIRQRQIDRAVRLILCRGPSPAESREFGAYLEQHGLPNLCRLLLNSNEFLFLN